MWWSGSEGGSLFTSLMVVSRRTADGGAAGELDAGSGERVAPSRVGMPKPGVAALWSPTTSPKKGLRLCSFSRVGEATLILATGFPGSAVDLVPLTRDVLVLAVRALAGDGGAGCGRSRGFRLLNLYEP